MPKPVCGSHYIHPVTYVEFICLERRGHSEEDGTMHEADTMIGPVNW